MDGRKGEARWINGGRREKIERAYGATDGEMEGGGETDRRRTDERFLFSLCVGEDLASDMHGGKREANAELLCSVLAILTKPQFDYSQFHQVL